MEAREYTEFTCPTCGGHTFGSSGIGTSTPIYHCHTRDCRFTWPQCDMWKYMAKVTLSPFASAEAYQAHLYPRESVTHAARGV